MIFNDLNWFAFMNLIILFMDLLLIQTKFIFLGSFNYLVGASRDFFWNTFILINLIIRLYCYIITVISIFRLILSWILKRWIFRRLIEYLKIIMINLNATFSFLLYLANFFRRSHDKIMYIILSKINKFI